MVEDLSQSLIDTSINRIYKSPRAVAV